MIPANDRLPRAPRGLHIVTTLVPLALLVVSLGSGCGKKEPEPAEPSASGDALEVGEAPLEAPEGERDEARALTEADATAAAAAAGADADEGEEGKRAKVGEPTGRDRLGGRRPPPGDLIGRPGPGGDGAQPREPGMRPGPMGRKPLPTAVPTIDGAAIAGEPGGVAVPGGPEDVARPEPAPPQLRGAGGEPGEGAPVEGAGVEGPKTRAPPLPQGAPAEGPAAVGGRPELAMATPDADKLLPLTTLTEVIPTRKLTPAGPLPGIAVQPGYSSFLYAAADGKALGVSLQVWQDPARRESDDRFRRMRLQYPNAEDVSAMPPARAFYSHFQGVQMLTFVDSVKRVVASVACGEGVCTHAQLLKLARSVRDRL